MGWAIGFLGGYPQASRTTAKLANSTIKTLTKRLVAKGFIARERAGRGYLYKAAAGPQVRQIVMRRFFQGTLQSGLAPFVAFLRGSGLLRPADAKAARALLASCVERR